MTPDNRRQKVIGVNYDLLFTIGPGFRPVPGISILITHVNSLWAYQIFMNAQATTHIGQRPTFATALRDALTLARDFSNQLSMTNSSVNLKNLLEQLPDEPAEVEPATAEPEQPGHWENDVLMNDEEEDPIDRAHRASADITADRAAKSP